MKIHKQNRVGLIIRPFLFLLGFASGFFIYGEARADYTATVNASVKYQTVEGWGTSLCWWANVIGGFPSANRTPYITLFFDPVNGLGLNVVRYNIGGGENPADHYLSYRARVPGFEPSNGTWDWTADANQRWVLQQAIANGANVLEAFSNSPPYWMTVSQSVTGAAGGADNLNTAYNSNFANYLATVVKHYHDSWGITFNTVDALNEPEANWWVLGGTQEGCHFDVGFQNTIVQLLSASLVSNGVTGTKISAPDSNSIDTAARYMGGQYTSSTIADLGQINTHGYNGTSRTQLASLASSLGKDLHMSEYGDSDASGLTMSREILNDMKTMMPTAWVYWQAVDSAAGWGFVTNPLDGSTNYGYTFNEKYYVMANYSKFIRHGYQIVDINDANSLAALSADGQTLVIVTTGATSAANVTYDLSNFTNAQWTATPYQTSSSQNLVQLASFPISGGAFTASIPANSVTTFVLTSAIPNGTYRIMARNSGKALDVAGAGTANGTNVDQWTYSGGSNQRWTVTSLGNGQYKIIGVGSGLALDVSGQSTAPGANVDIWSYWGGNNQKWTITPTSGGYYTITSVNSSNVLDVASGSGSNGANVDQWTSTGGLNQQWEFLAP